MTAPGNSSPTVSSQSAARMLSVNIFIVVSAMFVILIDDIAQIIAG
jgi:hypothetical protein